MSCFTFAGAAAVGCTNQEEERFFSSFFIHKLFFSLCVSSLSLTSHTLACVARVFGTSLNYSRLILISFVFSCFRELLSADELCGVVGGVGWGNRRLHALRTVRCCELGYWRCFDSGSMFSTLSLME